MTATDRLIARANAAIVNLRHAAADNQAPKTDARKALRLADVIEEAIHRPDEQILAPEVRDLSYLLADWGAWIRHFTRAYQ